MFEGIAIYNALKASTATINVYIDGLAEHGECDCDGRIDGYD